MKKQLVMEIFASNGSKLEQNIKKDTVLIWQGSRYLKTAFY